MFIRINTLKEKVWVNVLHFFQRYPHLYILYYALPGMFSDSNFPNVHKTAIHYLLVAHVKK